MKNKIYEYFLENINPITGQTFTKSELPDVTYDEKTEMLFLNFPFEKPENSHIDTFQRPLLRFLKLGMSIPKVKLYFLEKVQPKVHEPALKNPENFESLSSLIEKNNDKTPLFITIASGKGGVGKSQTTVELARALQRAGKHVGIIDADIYGSSIRKILNTNALHDSQSSTIKPITVDGFQVASADMLIEGNKPVIWRGPMLGRIIRHFFEDMQWDSKITHFLIDLPPGTGDVALDLQALLPKGSQILVTTPHENAAHVAIRAGIMAQSAHTPVLGVIENMAYFEDEIHEVKHFIFGKTGGDTVARELNVPLLARIPISSTDKPRSLDLFYDQIIKQIF